MKITIISIGKKSPKDFDNHIADYQKRLIGHNCSLEWLLIPPPKITKDTSSLVKISSSLVLKSLPTRAYVVLLDELGSQIQSVELAKLLDKFSQTHPEIVFIIGGSYGVSEELKKRADFIWSLGKLIFPHQIVRLLLAEQIYRAVSINSGSNYHHQ